MPRSSNEYERRTQKQGMDCCAMCFSSYLLPQTYNLHAYHTPPPISRSIHTPKTTPQSGLSIVPPKPVLPPWRTIPTTCSITILQRRRSPIPILPQGTLVWMPTSTIWRGRMRGAARPSIRTRGRSILVVMYAVTIWWRTAVATVVRLSALQTRVPSALGTTRARRPGVWIAHAAFVGGAGTVGGG